MARQCFREKSFKPPALELINRCNEIVGRYLRQNLRMTARQLFYQLVTQNIIRNEERAYKGLTKLVSDARLAGLIDWAAIEDRVRRPDTQSQWENIASLVDSAVAAYRLPRWRGQSSYVELWVEKDALAGVLAPLAEEFHVTLMVNRGYSSQSAMYESAARYRHNLGQMKKDSGAVQPLLLYLGDHDPSGEDMVRDIRDRLVMFGVKQIDVRKLALTRAQIDEYDPPPNPAKLTDPRAEAYVAEHGNESWEVDALPPDVLAQIIRASFEEIIDQELMDTIIAREEVHRERLREAALTIDEEDENE